MQIVLQFHEITAICLAAACSLEHSVIGDRLVPSNFPT